MQALTAHTRTKVLLESWNVLQRKIASSVQPDLEIWYGSMTQKELEIQRSIQQAPRNLSDGQLIRWFVEGDSVTLSYALSLWYVLWYDFVCEYVRATGADLDPAQLWNRGTFLKWAESFRSQDAFYLFQKLDDCEMPLLSSLTQTDLLQSIQSCIKATCLPMSAKLARDLPYHQVTSLVDWVRPVRSLIDFLLRISINAWVPDPGLDDWLAEDDNLPDESNLIRSFASFCHESCRLKQPGPVRMTKLPSGAVSDAKGAYAQPGVKVQRQAVASQRAFLTLARYGFEPPFKLLVVDNLMTNRRLAEPVLGSSYPDVVLHHRNAIVGEPESAWMAVPKNWKKRRPIVKEPSFQAICQTNVHEKLADAIAQRWKHHCDPVNQDHNRRLVANPRYATIDLKSASDRVTLPLLKAAFPSKWYKLLTAMRTQVVKLPDWSEKPVHILKKYAGMGNGTTFPVECHVFCCIVKYCIHLFGWDPSLDWGVFGDDIVVPHEWYSGVISVLEALGLRVNAEKSWSWPFLFRESCGHDYFNGVYCTPFRLSRKFHETAAALARAFAGKALRGCEAGLLGLVSLQVSSVLEWTYGEAALTRLLSSFIRLTGGKFSNQLQVYTPDEVWERWRDPFLYCTAAYSATGDPGVRYSYPTCEHVVEEPDDQSRLWWNLMNGTRPYTVEIPRDVRAGFFTKSYVLDKLFEARWSGAPRLAKKDGALIGKILASSGLMEPVVLWDLDPKDKGFRQVMRAQRKEFQARISERNLVLRQFHYVDREWAKVHSGP